MSLNAINKAENAASMEHSINVRYTLFGTEALTGIARKNAGTAFHLHQLALGKLLASCLNFKTRGESIACVQGTYGLARYALARFLRGIVLDAHESALLADYFACGSEQSLPLI